MHKMENKKEQGLKKKKKYAFTALWYSDKKGNKFGFLCGPR